MLRAEQQCLVLDCEMGLSVFTICPHQSFVPPPYRVRWSEGTSSSRLSCDTASAPAPDPCDLYSQEQENPQFWLSFFPLHFTPVLLSPTCCPLSQNSRRLMLSGMHLEEIRARDLHCCDLGPHSPLLRWSKLPHKSSPFNS